MPDSVEIPAPVSTTICRASRRRVASCSSTSSRMLGKLDALNANAREQEWRVPGTGDAPLAGGRVHRGANPRPGLGVYGSGGGVVDVLERLAVTLVGPV